MTLAGKLQRSGDANGVPGATYPLEQITCPIALFHGQSDYLANCAGLVRFFRDQCVPERANGYPKNQDCRRR